MELQIEEWEIWHTYTSFLETTSVDLQESARRLVASGIAECAMVCDGRTYWRANGTVASGSTEIEIGSTNGPSTFKLKLDEGCKAEPERFALEAWGQAAYFLISEHRLLGDYSMLPRPYLRAYLGKCVLTSTGNDKTSSELNLYPTLIIYESGIVIIEFRMIGPTTPTPLGAFITSGVNLFQYKFDRVEVTPGLSTFATRAYYLSTRKWNFIRRVQLAWLQVGHEIAVRKRTRKQVDEDFSFDLAPLSNSKGDDLKAIALTIFYTAALFVGGPKTGLSFLLWGQPGTPRVGTFWSGRPHIHLVRFNGQCKTASENEAYYGAAFGRILSRAVHLNEVEARKALPKNARLFGDYNAYVTSASSLWVWSKDGLVAQQNWMDANRGNLIYERQVLAELLEYGYMLHRSLYHRVETFKTTAEVISVRKEILQLRLKMREVSHSGEIRQLLENGWNELGLRALTSEIDAALELRALETSSIEAMRSTRVGWALTIVFGFVAVPALADQVIKPIWKLTPFYKLNDSLTAVVSDGIAALIVLLVMWITVFLLSPRQRNVG
jgi:hypothetical protein